MRGFASQLIANILYTCIARLVHVVKTLVSGHIGNKHAFMINV